MFSPPKTPGVHIWWGWALSQSWSGTSHDPILPGRLPEPLLTLPSQALQKSSESAGCSHGLPGRYPTLLQKRLTLKSETGTLPLGTHTASQSEELLTGCSPMEIYLFSWGPSLLQSLSNWGPWCHKDQSGHGDSDEDQDHLGTLLMSLKLWECYVPPSPG